MEPDDELWGALDRVSVTRRLLVVCGFDGALAAPTDDPAAARAEQPSSEALNVLMALADTSVAVVSRRAPDEVSELMFLSGSKGGVRIVLPEQVPGLRAELEATGLVAVGAGDAAAGDAWPGDVVVEIDRDTPSGYRVDDAEDVAEVLEELARLRRRP